MFSSLRALLIKEIEEVNQTATLCHERLSRRAEFASRNEEDILADSLAACLHSFYTGVENMLETIAIELEEGLPKGDKWHKKLLMQMASEIPKVREQVLSESSFEQLETLRTFRHLFRNLYTHRLSPERVFQLTVELEQTWKDVRKDLENFLGYLEKLNES